MGDHFTSSSHQVFPVDFSLSPPYMRTGDRPGTRRICNTSLRGGTGGGLNSPHSDHDTWVSSNELAAWRVTNWSRAAGSDSHDSKSARGTNGASGASTCLGSVQIIYTRKDPNAKQYELININQGNGRNIHVSGREARRPSSEYGSTLNSWFLSSL